MTVNREKHLKLEIVEEQRGRTILTKCVKVKVTVKGEWLVNEEWLSLFRVLAYRSEQRESTQNEEVAFTHPKRVIIPSPSLSLSSLTLGVIQSFFICVARGELSSLTLSLTRSFRLNYRLVIN